MPFECRRHTLVSGAGENEEREECGEEKGGPPQAEKERGHGLA